MSLREREDALRLIEAVADILTESGKPTMADELEAAGKTLRAQLEAAESEIGVFIRKCHTAIGRAEAAEARCARISEAIDLAFDAAASDLEANKAEYEFDHINGAYYGLCLMRMEINKARTKEQQA